jgi:hypothetical protein
VHHLGVGHHERVQRQDDAAEQGRPETHQPPGERHRADQQQDVDQDHAEAGLDEQVHKAGLASDREVLDRDAGQPLHLRADGEAGHPHRRDARMAALERAEQVAMRHGIGEVAGPAHPVVFVRRDEERDPNQARAEGEDEQEGESGCAQQTCRRCDRPLNPLGEESHHVASPSVQYGTIAFVRPLGADAQPGGT